jgi:hypothetical protein
MMNSKNGCANKNHIICGFSGVGKSTAEQKHKNVIDWESSGFSHTWLGGRGDEPRKNDEFPKNYVDAVLEHCVNKTNYIHLLSCHQEVRDELKRRGIDYIIVMPTIEQKNEYIKRWLMRGSPMDFIVSMAKRWDDMIRSCEEDDAPKIYLKESEYINDILPV